MNRLILALLTILVLVSGCTTTSTTPQTADARFQAASQKFLAAYLKHRPEMAVGLGLHEFDGQVSSFALSDINAELKHLKAIEAELAGFNSTELHRTNDLQRLVILAGIRNEIFQTEVVRAHQRNPMNYITVIDPNMYLKRNYAPLEVRLKAIIASEKHTAEIFAAARKNLESTLAKPFVETAIPMARGAASFLTNDLPKALAGVTNAALMAEFKKVNARAAAEFIAYADWLKNERLGNAHTNYAVGRENFARMMRDSELVTLSPESILEIGLKRLKQEQQEFADTARKIDPTKPAIEVFKALQKEHPTPESLLPDARRNLEMIHSFLSAHHIVSIPSPVRVKVEETPPHLRATSFASMDTPGPFEKGATEAYYYITPTESNWSAQQKDEWLTAFNFYTTDVVSIHEAYPGHYMQFIHLNASGAAPVQKVFTSYAFTEGWAHYTEQMMIEEGFGNASVADSKDSPELRAAKYHLAQLDESLLRLCRLVVAIRTHCQGMSVAEAKKFFVENCYYEDKPAGDEAVRGTFDPGYLNYTVGKLQLLKLRDDYRAQEGAAFSLQKFHDEILSHGAPPVRLLRELLLKDSAKWDQLL